MPVSQQSMTQQFTHAHYALHNMTRHLPDVVVLSSVVEFQEVLDSVDRSQCRRPGATCLGRGWLTIKVLTSRSVPVSLSISWTSPGHRVVLMFVRRLPHIDGCVGRQSNRSVVQSSGRRRCWRSVVSRSRAPVFTSIPQVYHDAATMSWRRLGFFFTCGCVGSVLQAEVCYNIFIYTSYNPHGSFDMRYQTNYKLFPT